MIASPVQRVGLSKLLLQQEVECLWEEVRNRILECNIFQDISCLRCQQTHEIQLNLVTGPTEVYVCVVCVCLCVMWCDLNVVSGPSSSWNTGSVQPGGHLLSLFLQIICLLENEGKLCGNHWKYEFFWTVLELPEFSVGLENTK